MINAPLVIALDKPYSPSGSGVFLTRTVAHVGYNGSEFRRLAACPKMKYTSKPLLRKA